MKILTACDINIYIGEYGRPSYERNFKVAFSQAHNNMQEPTKPLKKAQASIEELLKAIPTIPIKPIDQTEFDRLRKAHEAEFNQTNAVNIEGLRVPSKESRGRAPLFAQMQLRVSALNAHIRELQLMAPDQGPGVELLVNKCIELLLFKTYAKPSKFEKQTRYQISAELFTEVQEIISRLHEKASELDPKIEKVRQPFQRRQWQPTPWRGHGGWRGRGRGGRRGGDSLTHPSIAPPSRGRGRGRGRGGGRGVPSTRANVAEEEEEDSIDTEAVNKNDVFENTIFTKADTADETPFAAKPAQDPKRRAGQLIHACTDALYALAVDFADLSRLQILEENSDNIDGTELEPILRTFATVLSSGELDKLATDNLDISALKALNTLKEAVDHIGPAVTTKMQGFDSREAFKLYKTTSDALKELQTSQRHIVKTFRPFVQWLRLEIPYDEHEAFDSDADSASGASTELVQMSLQHGFESFVSQDRTFLEVMLKLLSAVLFHGGDFNRVESWVLASIHTKTDYKNPKSASDDLTFFHRFAIQLLAGMLQNPVQFDYGSFDEFFLADRDPFERLKQPKKKKEKQDEQLMRREAVLVIQATRVVLRLFGLKRPSELSREFNTDLQERLKYVLLPSDGKDYVDDNGWACNDIVAILAMQRTQFSSLFNKSIIPAVTSMMKEAKKNLQLTKSVTDWLPFVQSAIIRAKTLAELGLYQTALAAYSTFSISAHTRKLATLERAAMFDFQADRHYTSKINLVTRLRLGENQIAHYSRMAFLWEHYQKHIPVFDPDLTERARHADRAAYWFTKMIRVSRHWDPKNTESDFKAIADIVKNRVTWRPVSELARCVIALPASNNVPVTFRDVKVFTRDASEAVKRKHTVGLIQYEPLAHIPNGILIRAVDVSPLLYREPGPLGKATLGCLLRGTSNQAKSHELHAEFPFSDNDRYIPVSHPVTAEVPYRKEVYDNWRTNGLKAPSQPWLEEEQPDNAIYLFQSDEHDRVSNVLGAPWRQRRWKSVPLKDGVEGKVDGNGMPVEASGDRSFKARGYKLDTEARVLTASYQSSIMEEFHNNAHLCVLGDETPERASELVAAYVNALRDVPDAIDYAVVIQPKLKAAFPKKSDNMEYRNWDQLRAQMTRDPWSAQTRIYSKGPSLESRPLDPNEFAFTRDVALRPIFTPERVLMPVQTDVDTHSVKDVVLVGNKFIIGARKTVDNLHFADSSKKSINKLRVGALPSQEEVNSILFSRIGKFHGAQTAVDRRHETPPATIVMALQALPVVSFTRLGENFSSDDAQAFSGCMSFQIGAVQVSEGANIAFMSGRFCEIVLEQFNSVHAARVQPLYHLSQCVKFLDAFERDATKGAGDVDATVTEVVIRLRKLTKLFPEGTVPQTLPPEATKTAAYSAVYRALLDVAIEVHEFKDGSDVAVELVKSLLLDETASSPARSRAIDRVCAVLQFRSMAFDRLSSMPKIPTPDEQIKAVPQFRPKPQTKKEREEEEKALGKDKLEFDYQKIKQLLRWITSRLNESAEVTARIIVGRISGRTPRTGERSLFQAIRTYAVSTWQLVHRLHDAEGTLGVAMELSNAEYDAVNSLIEHIKSTRARFVLQEATLENMSTALKKREELRATSARYWLPKWHPERAMRRILDWLKSRATSSPSFAAFSVDRKIWSSLLALTLYTEYPPFIRTVACVQNCTRYTMATISTQKISTKRIDGVQVFQDPYNHPTVLQFNKDDASSEWGKYMTEKFRDHDTLDGIELAKAYIEKFPKNHQNIPDLTHTVA